MAMVNTMELTSFEGFLQILKGVAWMDDVLTMELAAIWDAVSP